MADLDIAELFYETGQIQFRYSRYMSIDRGRWIRHGRFTAYHGNGRLASEGEYVDGAEDGYWRDFHENGQLVAEGLYTHGVQTGKWRFWNDDGTEYDG